MKAISVSQKLGGQRSDMIQFVFLEDSHLHCIVLYCIVLYCIVLYCIALYSFQPRRIRLEVRQGGIAIIYTKDCCGKLAVILYVEGRTIRIC